MLALASLLGGATALAATQAADVPVPWWAQALIALSGTIVTFLLGLLARALNAAFDYLAAKTKLAKLAEIDEFIMGFVSHVSQHELKALKEAAADGKLSPEEIAQLKSIPIEAAKEQFGFAALAKIVGENVEGYLASRVERAVVAHKAASPANP